MEDLKGTIESIIDKRVQDRLRFVGDTGVRMDLHALAAASHKLRLKISLTNEFKIAIALSEI
jgi:hypothetical protein